jgi:hypothetical protein
MSELLTRPVQTANAFRTWLNDAEAFVRSLPDKAKGGTEPLSRRRARGRSDEPGSSKGDVMSEFHLDEEAAQVAAEIRNHGLLYKPEDLTALAYTPVFLCRDGKAVVTPPSELASAFQEGPNVPERHRALFTLLQRKDHPKGAFFVLCFRSGLPGLGWAFDNPAASPAGM